MARDRVHVSGVHPKLVGRVGLKVGGVSSFWWAEYFWGGRKISARGECFWWAVLQRLHNGCVNELKPFIGLPTQPVLVRIEPKLDVWMSAKETDASANASTCPTRRKGSGRPAAKSS